ncbi:hypothetical protein LG307_02600 [Sutcliffiella horikoshii]|uniref:hypothetical protein n=1 Tax=Sutcliffiella horikoshii TaxID=79883 RepID=UPI00384AA62B
MEFINMILSVFILYIYYKLLKAGLQYLDKKNFFVELRTLVNSIFISILSTIVLFLPIREGLHKYFAMGGLTVVVVLLFLLVWIGLAKKINQQLYEKSVRVLEKVLATII